MDLKWRVGLAATLCASFTHAAQDGAAEYLKTPIRWHGVEVITNDFGSVGRVRELAALEPGVLLLISDPRLKAACDAVRKELASSKVVCTNVMSATAGGPPNAWYLVEVDIQEHAQLPCQSGGALGEDLLQLNEAWQERLGRSVLEGVVTREHVTDRKYLDFDDAQLSAIVRRIHAATQGRADELQSAASSCDPRQRAAAFYLMNFVGEPERFVQIAGAHINDSDAGAANAATRFLMRFAAFVSAADVPRLAAEACRSLQEGGFTARNKSLGLFSAWKESGALSFAQLAPACQQQVRNIAHTSVAEQLALPARELSDYVDR